MILKFSFAYILVMGCAFFINETLFKFLAESTFWLAFILYCLIVVIIKYMQYKKGWKL